MPSPATPLAGIKVLEFSHTVMGPSVGLLLAEPSADVVKIEPAPNGDHTRRLGGFGAGFFAAREVDTTARDERSCRTPDEVTETSALWVGRSARPIWPKSLPFWPVMLR